MRYFNVAGPCIPGKHYMIDASTRLDGVKEMIDRGDYFVIHAARQSGKTTYLQDLTKRLNDSGKYYALYCSLEALEDFTNPIEAIPMIVNVIKSELKAMRAPHYKEFALEEITVADTAIAVKDALSDYCRILDKPFVLFFDEADGLSAGTLITFLRQLRTGYITRGTVPFVHSIALVGLRDIRDYKATARGGEETLGSTSPFNIITEALTLKNFTEEEVRSLYQQHTDETGQVFEPDAIDKIYEQTQGQPWLVNAIAREVIEKMLASDFTKPVTADLVETAIQNLILRRDTHFDSLLKRLREPRVQRVIEPLLIGGRVDTTTDDYSYTRDLGLIRETPTKIEPANPIYGEIIVRYLNASLHDELRREKPQYQMPRYLQDGRINVDLLLKDFQQFWCENSERCLEQFEYMEAAPHLILQAFLQRVVNGGGQIIPEMALGIGRSDLCIVYGGQKYPIELKLWRGEKHFDRSLTQIAAYMDRCLSAEGWLVIFDRRKGLTWEERIFQRKEPIDGKTVTVVGC